MASLQIQEIKGTDEFQWNWVDLKFQSIKLDVNKRSLGSNLREFWSYYVSENHTRIIITAAMELGVILDQVDVHWSWLSGDLRL